MDATNTMYTKHRTVATLAGTRTRQHRGMTLFSIMLLITTHVHCLDVKSQLHIQENPSQRNDNLSETEMENPFLLA